MRLCLIRARSFSQVVADSQFSVLGVTFLAELAKVRAVVDSMTGAEPVVAGRRNIVEDAHDWLKFEELEDLGRPIERHVSPPGAQKPFPQDLVPKGGAQMDHSTGRSGARSAAITKHQRPKKGLSAIDQLFSTLE